MVWYGSLVGARFGVPATHRIPLPRWCAEPSMMHQTERLAALKRVPILAELPQSRLEQVGGICKWRDYEAGEQILSYDDPSTEVFFLASGKVRVIVYSAEGKAVVFTD